MVFDIRIQSFFAATSISKPAMDLGKQIFTQCVLLVLATDSFSLLAFFPPTIVSLSGLWEISGCSPCSVHKNLRSGPLVHLLRLFTPLEPLYHPDIMQNSALFHEAYSCLNKTFCSRIPSNLSKGPSSLDLQILT